MGKKIIWSREAKADVRAIDQQSAMRVLHGLGRFLDCATGDVKRLQGIDPPEFDYEWAIIAFASTITAVQSKFSPSSIARTRTNNG
jgi:hypothetical protein